MGLDEQEITRTDEQKTSPVKPDKAYNRVLWIVAGVVFSLALVIVFRARPADQRMTLTLQPDSVRLAVAEEGVNGNNEWAPYIQQFDGVPMALVPAGCFLMGSTRSESEEAFQLCEEIHGEGEWECDYEQFYYAERPKHRVCFEEPFWIDVYEVTNGQYGDAGKYCIDWSSESDQPRVCINWFEADAHCTSRGARLPTEAEWEYTARGPDGLLYPWGDDFVDGKVVYGQGPSDQTAPVGSSPADLSWVGVYDLSGNVSEWINDYFNWDLEYYGRSAGINPQGPKTGGSLRIMRGGTWRDSGSYTFRAAYRDWTVVEFSRSIAGFRCARDYEP